MHTIFSHWLFYAILAATSYATYGLSMKQAGNLTNAFTFGATINLVGAVFIFIIGIIHAFYYEGRIHIATIVSDLSSFKLILIVLITGLSLAFIDIFSFIMLTKAPGSGVAFSTMYIIALSIIALGGVLIFKDSISLQNLIGFALAFISIILLSN
jgi:drug/metabolite transporter (DMT)-like permease